MRSSIDQGLCVIAECDEGYCGFALGTRTGLPFNSRFPIGTELAWYVTPGARQCGAGKQLREQLEAQARAAGLLTWGMAVLTKSSPSMAAEQLQLNGYNEFERVYLKGL